ncbi:hypothetical protein ACWEQL_39740 [Kitasatospora sp. NPDC004240]
MTNAPHLLAEDRPDFERLLNEALRDGTVLTALRAAGGPTAEQLRARALLAADTLAAPAAGEYARYTALRERLGRDAPPGPVPEDEPTAPSLLTQLRSAEGGAGLFPVLTVLTPILAWAAALLLLLIGYVLRAADPALPLARSVLTAGWVALAAGAAAMLVGIVGLVLTALRDGAAPPAGPVPPGSPAVPHPRADPERAADLDEARRRWQEALRERALLPYLHAQLRPDRAGPAAADSTGPDFTSPGYSGPRYSGPGFSSPGVEGLTDPEGREPRTASFTGPDFSGPGYTPPAFTGPDDV